MGYLVHILLAVLATGLAELGFAAPFELPYLAGVLCAVPYLLAAAVRRSYVHGRFKRGGFLSLLLTRCAPVLQLVCVGLLGWTKSVSTWTGASFSLLDWPSPAVLIALAPYVAYELCAIDARVRLSEPTFSR